MGPSSWFLVLFGATWLVGCGPSEHHDAVKDAAASALPSPTSSGVVPEAEPPSTVTRGEGMLSVSARSALQRRLSVVTFVVRDAAGEVVAGGEQEANGGNTEALGLSLALPAGVGFRLELTATATHAEASICTASVGPFRIEAGSEASFEVFVWRCDGAPGAAAPEPECYWLADWIGVTRTSAALGELIGVSAAGHDAAGGPARFNWSTSAPEQGRFIDAHAAETTFSCAAPNAALPVSVSMSDGQCEGRFSRLVSCR
jgi:hypothetical protein